MHPKTKQQQKRLSANVRQAKSNHADAKKSAQKGNKKPAATPPASKTGGGFFDKVFGGKAPQSAQQSIPYREMYRDGICRVNDRLYTKTISFGDINYHLAQNEDKTTIFEGWCDFLNYFDSSISVQISAVNQYANAEELRRLINIPDMDDGQEVIRDEYREFLQGQQAKGNNGLIKTKYVTFGIEADSLKAAKLRIERVEADIMNNYKTLGVPARSLTGTERLEVIHGQLHPDGTAKFRFDWKDRVKTGLSTKDYIAPSSFDFRDGRTFRMGEHYGAVSHLQILAPELTDRMLADFLDIDAPVTVTLHIKSIDQSEAIKTVKRKLSDLDAMKIAEQKKAVRAGYDMDIIPTDLATYGSEAKTLLEDLQSRNERMFLVTIIVMNTAKKKSKLDNDIFAAAGVAQKYNCALKRLDFQQEQGLMSSLPLGLNQIEIQRGLTTSSVAIFVPFTTCELFQTGEAMYYGLNALSNNLIMANRKSLKNPNGLYCQGTDIIRNTQAVNPLRHKSIDTDPKKEGGMRNERHRIYPLRRLPVTQYHTQRTAARSDRTPRQICPYAAGLPAGTPPDTLQSAIAVRAVIPPSARGRRSGAEQISGDCRPRNSARNNSCGAGLHLTVIPLSIQRDRQIPPQKKHAPTARETRFISAFYTTRADNSIGKGAALCRVI